ncbi:putative phage abortive infection protein [Duganella sp. LjRoot269]|uniref:putative phage abortive infection protein n=1 Tax=Duganella sp. LjRoot269 TaxID=3342305 RepID=UPI003ECEB13E
MRQNQADHHTESAKLSEIKLLEGKLLSKQSVRDRLPSAHWGVLSIAIACALVLWIGWSSYGVPFFHQRLITSTKTATGKSLTPQTNPSASKEDALPDRTQLLAEYGQTGDAFGSLNALLTALAGAFVFWAGFMQHQSLKGAREEAERERAYRHKQEFESLFFQLLGFSSSAADKIERRQGSKNNDATRPTRLGTRALDSFAASLYEVVNPEQQGASDTDTLRKLMQEFYVRVYDRHPSAFGPYYRTLLQIYEHIANSGLSITEQHIYAQIAKGQMSEGSLLLLALYALTYQGHSFVPHIERYGLLEHMHRRHKMAYKAALLTGYSPCAFQFRVEDIERDDEQLELPKLSATYFDSLNSVREQADAEADFKSGYSHDTEFDA